MSKKKQPKAAPKITSDLPLTMAEAGITADQAHAAGIEVRDDGTIVNGHMRARTLGLLGNTRAIGEAMNVPIGSLLFGQDHPGLASNVRQTGRDDNLMELTRSIIAEGLLQPLLVWSDTDTDDGNYYVVDGGRRLKAIHTIREAGGTTILSSVPVLLFKGGTAADALAKSLAANITQLPLHPVDQFEAFATVKEKAHGEGRDPLAAISERYGVTPLVAERRLRLGTLAACVREAWRAGEIEQHVAMAFTLLTDIDAQAALFARLKKRGLLHSNWAVRKEIVGEDHTIHRVLKFVGAEAYEAAGGVRIRDLFAEEDGAGDGVSDRTLLHKLASDKIDEQVEDIKLEGWAWVERADAMPSAWSYSWAKLPIGKKVPTEEQKKKSGVVVGTDMNGEWAITYGVMKPAAARAAKKATAKASGKPEKETAPEISRDMQTALTNMATAGLAKALALQADVCLAALVAGMTVNGDGPIRAQATGMERRLAGQDDIDAEFAETFRPIVKGGKANAMKGVATIASGALDLLMSGDPLPLQERNAAAIVNALHTKAVNKALRENFRAADYFKGVSKHFCRAAIVEALGLETFGRVSSSSKDDIAIFAIANVPKTGWLPPELRIFGYDGPGERPKLIKATPKKRKK